MWRVSLSWSASLTVELSVPPCNGAVVHSPHLERVAAEFTNARVTALASLPAEAVVTKRRAGATAAVQQISIKRGQDAEDK